MYIISINDIREEREKQKGRDYSTRTKYGASM